MYKYERSRTLVESMTKMMDIFKKNNIRTIFVFDGKPDENKRALIDQRRCHKDDIRRKSEELYLNADKMEDGEERDKILNDAKKIRKQCVYITAEKVNTVKKLIESYDNTEIIDAVGEADGICASLVIKKKAWACLSDDTDMFIYGCPRVIRCLNIYNSSCILYRTFDIFAMLNMSHQEFKQMCVLCGTDYNLDQKNSDKNSIDSMKNLFVMYKMHNQQQKHQKYKTNTVTFYDWVVDVKPNISIPNYSVFERVINMF